MKVLTHASAEDEADFFEWLGEVLEVDAETAKEAFRVELGKMPAETV